MVDRPAGPRHGKGRARHQSESVIGRGDALAGKAVEPSPGLKAAKVVFVVDVADVGRGQAGTPGSLPTEFEPTVKLSGNRLFY
jgi:hypothetical protein